MADLSVDEVLALLDHDRNIPHLAELLCDLDDKQRKQLSGPVQKHAEDNWLSRDGQGARAVAVLGCVTGVRQVAARLEWLAVDGPSETAAVDVLRARRPHWLPALPEALLVGREGSPNGFRLVRALVREGLVEPPEFPEYPLAMIQGLVGRRGWRDGPTVLECLRADTGLADDELWRLFRTEGAGRTFANHDSWLLKPYEMPGSQETIPARPERTWRHALVTLAADGAIDRSRLLDAAIGTFLRDWTPGDVAWFVQLHDELTLTLDELAERQETYGRLLSVEPGPPAKLGLRSLRSLLDSQRLELDVLLRNAPAVLTRRDKGTVVDALKLLAATAEAEPSQADRIAEAAAHALTHERVDVQERALALITDFVPDASRRNELAADHVDALAPSLRPEPQLVVPIEPASDRPRGAVPIEPVADVDELGELLARLVEEADDPVEVERLLDGIARMANQRPARGADALVKRLRDLSDGYRYLGDWFGQELRANLVQLGLVWLERRSPGRGYPGRQYAIDYQRRGGVMRSTPLYRPDWSLAGLVTMRAHEVAIAVRSGGGGPLLSFPSHRDGTLDAESLNARVKSAGRLAKPRPLDAGLAILRVPPDQYDRVRLPGRHRTASFLQEQLALLRAHRPSWELVTGDSKGLYHHDIYSGAVTWRDAGSPEGSPERLAAAVLDRRDPLLNLALEAADGEYTARFGQVIALWPLMLPHHPDLLAAHAHPRLNRALAKNRSGTEPLLEALGAADRPLGPPAFSALTLGLAAKNGVERTRAVDSIVDLSDRTMLDGRALGEVMASLLAKELIIGSRVVPGLIDAARSSGQAADAIVDCLSTLLPALDGRRDAHQFIDLLAQLAIQLGRTVALPEPFAAIAESKKSSMLAQACRRVPRPASGAG